jgi:DNA polymerase-1
MSTTIYIDGDIVAYQQSFLAEQATDWGNDFWTLHADVREAKKRVDVFIEELKDTLKADKVVIAVSSTKNFRKDIHPQYKEHRKKMRKPVALGEVREHLIYFHKAVHLPNIEADDVLSIMASEDGGIIVSLDKDFKSVPGKYYNWNKHEDGVLNISEEDADRAFMMQTLTGDIADNYQGCPGIGPKTAEKLLDKLTHIDAMWEAVKTAYKKAGFGETEALTQARLARILRKGEYNHKTGEVKLWRSSK